MAWTVIVPTPSVAPGNLFERGRRPAAPSDDEILRRIEQGVPTIARIMDQLLSDTHTRTGPLTLKAWLRFKTRMMIDRAIEGVRRG